MENGAILLIRLGRHENRLMGIGIELLKLDRGIEALEAVLLQRAHQDGLGHLDAVVQGDEVVVAGKALAGDGRQGAVEVVDAIDQVRGELLQGEVLGCLDLALGALLEVAEVGNGAEIFVLGGFVNGVF